MPVSFASSASFALDLYMQRLWFNWRPHIALDQPRAFASWRQVLRAEYQPPSPPATWNATFATLCPSTGTKRLFVLKRSQPPAMLPMNGNNADRVSNSKLPPEYFRPCQTPKTIAVDITTAHGIPSIGSFLLIKPRSKAGAIPR